MRTFVLWAVIIELIVSGLMMIARGATESTKHYGPSDVIAAAIEVPLVIWGVVWLATT